MVQNREGDGRRLKHLLEWNHHQQCPLIGENQRSPDHPEYPQVILGLLGTPLPLSFRGTGDLQFIRSLNSDEYIEHFNTMMELSGG